MQLSVQMTYFLTTHSYHTYPCSEQTKGFSPVCSRWCVFNCPLCVKAFAQPG